MGWLCVFDFVRLTACRSCSPSAFNGDETLSSLRFGARAKTIVSKVHKNEEKGVEELKQEVRLSRVLLRLQALSGLRGVQVKYWRGVARELEVTVKKLLASGGANALSEDERKAIVKLTDDMAKTSGGGDAAAVGGGGGGGGGGSGALGVSVKHESEEHALRAERDILQTECDGLRDKNEQLERRLEGDLFRLSCSFAVCWPSADNVLL